MTDWLKRVCKSIWFAIGALGAAYVAYEATSRRQESRKWQDRAIAEQESDVQESIDQAEASMSQAKLHAAEADRIAAKAEAKINKLAESDETVTDIVDRWRADSVRGNPS